MPRVFYCLDSGEARLQSSQADDATLRELVRDFLPRLIDADDFIGVLDSYENILQISYQPEANIYQAELLFLEEKRSHRCDMNREKMTQWLLELPRVLTPENLPDSFSPCNW